MKGIMKRLIKKERFLWVSIISLIFIVQFCGSVGNSDSDYEEDMYYDLMKEAMEYIRSSYVDESKISYKDLIYGAIKGMLSSLNDEHSMFLTEKDFKELSESLNNKFGGLGIYIAVRDDYPTVIAPIEGTPAYYKGVQPLDKIVEIEGKSSKGMKIEEAVSLLKGVPGTQVSIKVAREEALDLIPMTITRAIINVPTVKYGFIKEGIAYLRIISFGKQTTPGVKEALEKLKSGKMKKLIIDLRNNPGGFLTAAIRIADMFLDNGKIVYTKGRDPKRDETFYASDNKTLLDSKIPIVLLVNQGSASASEIVAGSIQDNKRGILIGSKTFGKASVQNIIPLKSSDNKAAIRVTIQKYFTPSGKEIHKKGILPDVVIDVPKKSFEDLYMERKLKEGKYINEFVKTYYKSNAYTDKALEDFTALLKTNGIVIKDELLKRYIRNEKYKKEIRLFDIDYDRQLKKAVEVIDKNSSYTKLLVVPAAK